MNARHVHHVGRAGAPRVAARVLGLPRAASSRSPGPLAAGGRPLPRARLVSSQVRAEAGLLNLLRPARSGESKGPEAYPERDRWLLVYKRLFLGEDHPVVTKALEGICKNTQKMIIGRFMETGGVDTHQGLRDAPPANRIVTSEDDLWILGSVMASWRRSSTCR